MRYPKSEGLHPALVIILFAMIPIGVIIDGLVLRYLWGLYLAQTFNLVALSLVQAIGLALTVRFVTNQREPEKKSDGYSANVRAVFAILETFARPSFAAFIGWIVSLFL